MNIPKGKMIDTANQEEIDTSTDQKLRAQMLMKAFVGKCVISGKNMSFSINWTGTFGHSCGPKEKPQIEYQIKPKVLLL